MAIAGFGTDHSLAPAEPFAPERVQHAWPRVRLSIIAREVVERSWFCQGPLAMVATWMEWFSALVTQAH